MTSTYRMIVAMASLAQRRRFLITLAAIRKLPETHS